MTHRTVGSVTLNGLVRFYFAIKNRFYGATTGLWGGGAGA